jgi:hypothetical protein
LNPRIDPKNLITKLVEYVLMDKLKEDGSPEDRLEGEAPLARTKILTYLLAGTETTGFPSPPPVTGAACKKQTNLRKDRWEEGFSLVCTIC